MKTKNTHRNKMEDVLSSTLTDFYPNCARSTEREREQDGELNGRGEKRRSEQSARSCRSNLVGLVVCVLTVEDWSMLLGVCTRTEKEKKYGTRPPKTCSRYRPTAD